MHDIAMPIRVGTFRTVPQAERAIHDLRAAGFRDEELAVVCSNERKEEHFPNVQHPVPDQSYSMKAIGVGGLAGAAIGGLALAAVTAATGGLGLMAAPVLVGGGAIGGAFTGAMSTRAFEKELGPYYEQVVQHGHILVAVEPKDSSPDRLAQAERILERAGTEAVPLAEG